MMINGVLTFVNYVSPYIKYTEHIGLSIDNRLSAAALPTALCSFSLGSGTWCLHRSVQQHFNHCNCTACMLMDCLYTTMAVYVICQLYRIIERNKMCCIYPYTIQSS
ncbi:hypothetical protein O5D80_004432 [Batrachochytrium dendrobatidis]|nr:hypothetical protein O5D80_004432 [Batrachochytrium dendrobatidis]